MAEMLRDPRVLLDIPDLWDALIFGQEVPEFHSHLWPFLIDDGIRYLVVELPGGHAKTSLISVKLPIWRLCRDPDDRICIMQKAIEQAKDVIRSIQREMTHNQKLTELYGPFKPPSDDDGYPWSTTTMRVAGNRDTAEKTNSVHAYGWSSTDIMGNRFKIFLGDDFVTSDNSDTPEKRQKIRTKEATEWTKTLIGAPNPRYILMGTPMFFDDAFEEKRDKASDYLGPGDWRGPGEVDKSGFVFIRRSAEKGRRAGRTLWPKQADWPYLEEQKQTFGYTDYLRRMCCEVGDPELAIFKEVALKGGTEEKTGISYPGCLDYERCLGDSRSGWRVICGADPSSGKDTGAAGQFAHVTIGVDKEKNVNLIDLFTAPVPMSRREDNDPEPPDGKSQIGTIIHRHWKYGALYTVIESNSQQYAWITTVKEADPLVRVKPHQTGRNKTQPEIGVESMAGLVESGKLRIPYGNAESRRKSDELINQLIRYPYFSLSDLVMALWFAVYSTSKRGRVVFHDYNAIRAAARPFQLIKKV